MNPYAPNFYDPLTSYPTNSTSIIYRPIVPLPNPGPSSVLLPVSSASSDFPRSTEIPLRDPSKKKKKKAHQNQRERRRNSQINDAFLDLQKLIPFAPEEQRLPKIKTLRLATNYIGFLTQILDEDNPEQPSSSSDQTESGLDFSQVVAAEIQTKNTYKKRAEILIQQGNKSEDATNMEQFAGLSSSSLGAHTWPRCSCCPF